MKKLIIFDLDNTLFQSKDSYPLILAEQIKNRWGINEEVSLSAMKNAEKKIGTDKNYASIKEFYKAYNEGILIELFGEEGKIRLGEFSKIVEDMKETVPVKLKLYPFVLDIVLELKRKGYLIAVLTGTWDKKVENFSDKEYAEQKRRTIEKLLENSGLSKLVDSLFVTYDKAIVKPHPEAFNMVLRHFNIDAKNSVMIGDKEADILASKVGITSILFNPKNKYSGETVPDYEFKDYRDLIKIIDLL